MVTFNSPKMFSSRPITPLVKLLSIGSTVRNVISELPVLADDEMIAPTTTIIRNLGRLLQLTSLGQ